MPTRHTQAAKTKAVAHAQNLIANDGLSASAAARTAANKAGVTYSTILRWAKAQNIDLPGLKRDQTKNATADRLAQYEAARADLKIRLHDGLASLVQRIPNIPDHQIATAIGIIIDKIRLEEGKATGRHEHVGLPALSDVEKMIAEAEAAANTTP